jgi:hypothetical protein
VASGKAVAVSGKKAPVEVVEEVEETEAEEEYKRPAVKEAKNALSQELKDDIEADGKDITEDESTSKEYLATVCSLHSSFIS